MASQPIFHLAEPGDWAMATDTYTPPSLATEGFIHCSTEHQLHEVARTFYAGREDLVLLTIDTELIGDGVLVYEDLYDHGDLFPHIYGPLPARAVVSTGSYTPLH